MAVLDRLGRERDFIVEPSEAPRIQSSFIVDLARHYQQRLVREENLDALLKLPPASLRARIESLISRMIDEEERLISYHDRIALTSIIVNETVGLGPLQELLGDDSITEIMVNGPNEVYIERAGQDNLELTNVRFDDSKHILHIVDRIIGPLGRRVDESSPMVDARLPEGHRLNAAIPPISIDGPVVTIRKFRKQRFTIDDLKGNLTLTPEMATFLKACVKAKLNILVSGGTGSGKTTTLNVLSSFIPPNERIVTIEEAAELRFHERQAPHERRPHVVRLEARPPNIEGEGEITIRQLVRNALRMRPNRIVVGEVRGPEALDMLQAMNTGHEGSLTTIHANSPTDALSRLETMVTMAELKLDLPAIRQIIGVLDIIVQQNRLVDNARRIVAISEMQGVEDGKFRPLEPIFVFRQTGRVNGKAVGYFSATGFVPKCMKRFEELGVELPLDIFDKERRVFVEADQ